MTSGTWDRHRGHAAGYDVLGLGYNYRMDEPRAALLTARLERPRGRTSRAAAALVHRYRELLADVRRRDRALPRRRGGRSSCYVMPVIVDDPELRDPLRAFMLEERKVQTSVLYPAMHEFTAYAGSRRASCRAASSSAAPS